MNREIAVKTLTGRGKLNYLYEKKISLENDISKTLGCWIINHHMVVGDNHCKI